MNITKRLPAANDYERSVLANVESFGWHCTSVTPKMESQQPPFSYTVGLSYSYGHPEFVIFGLPSKVSYSILSALAEAAESGKMWPLNEPCNDLLEGYPCVFVKVPRERQYDYVFSALWFYAEHEFSLYQVVWPDSEGHFPWHPAADRSFQTEQPVLGGVA